MCGRTRSCLSTESIQNETNAAIGENFEDIQPIENCSPGMSCPIVYYDMKARACFIQSMIWGFQTFASHLVMNARIETVTEKPLFRKLIVFQRCVFVVNGFYEWAKTGSLKIPFYFYQEQPMKLACLYKIASNGDYQFVILTRDSFSSIKEIHERMPVILSREFLPIWLDPNYSGGQVIREYFTDSSCQQLELKFHEVSTHVNLSSYQGLDCSTPLRSLEVYFPKVKAEGEPCSPTQNRSTPIPMDIKSPHSPQYLPEEMAPLEVVEELNRESPEAKENTPSGSQFYFEGGEIYCPICMMSLTPLFPNEQQQHLFNCYPST